MTGGSARSLLYKERPTPGSQGELLVRDRGRGRGEAHGPAHEAPCNAVAVARAQTSLTVRDADGGWSVLFQSKPPQAETNPSSRPLPHAQKRPLGLCLSACLRTLFLQSPGKSGPAAPLPRPSPSVLLHVCSFLGREIELALALCHAAPSLWLSLHLREASSVFYKKKTVFHVPCVPVTLWGPFGAKDRRGNNWRSLARHATPFPAVTGLQGGTDTIEMH